MRTELYAVELQITSAVVKVVLVFRKLYHMCKLTILFDNDICYMLNVSLESLETVKWLVVDDLCKSSQVCCAVNSVN